METAFGMKIKRTSCLQLMSLPTLKEQVWLMLSREILKSLDYVKTSFS